MIELIKQRLAGYRARNAIEEEQALKEIVQEIALYGLWRAGFFEVAAFQGGTSLRILHRLPRFSEDLDFLLKKPEPHFNWQAYLGPLLACLDEFGLKSEALDKSRMDQRVKKALLRNNSVSNQLNLEFYRGQKDRKLVIKLEIDVNPPAGSGYEYHFLDFPLDFEICNQDLSSNFALKLHALLCRPYVKGRDWYDFSWYLRQKVSPNLPHLRAALNQYGPWQDQDPDANHEWLQHALQDKVRQIDWKKAAADVERFLGSAEQSSLALWGERFFFEKIASLDAN